MRIAAFGMNSTLAGIGGIVLASITGRCAGRHRRWQYAAVRSRRSGRGRHVAVRWSRRVHDAVLGGPVISLIPNGLLLQPNVSASYQYVITGAFLLRRRCGRRLVPDPETV